MDWRVESRGIPHLPKPGRYPYFLYAVPKSATCAAFIKESRMEFLEANRLQQEIGVWGTQGSTGVGSFDRKLLVRNAD